ncbi:MAG: type VI secretion system protein TssA [Pirellulaceae bacterium]
MASPELLEFQRLADPISPENPAGEDLRADTSPTSIYYRIKDARSLARDAERQISLNGDTGGAAPDWQPILTLAPEVLAERSKDLEIAAYLIEALIREDGFAGLRDGFRLVRLMIQQYADSIYPLPDEDGIETRVAPLTSLNGEGGEGTLIRPILNTPLTENTSVGALSTSDYQQALELQHAPDDVRTRRVAQGGVSLEMFTTAVAETPPEVFRSLLDDIDAASTEFAELTKLLESQYGQDAPPSSGIRNALQSAHDTLEAVARDKLAMTEPAPAADAEPAEQEDPAAPKPAKAKFSADSLDALENREEAFKVILKVAEYFKRTEPHTPISYALERIVHWGRLPLPDLLKELIVDQSSVQQMFRLVGINPNKDDPMG